MAGCGKQSEQGSCTASLSPPASPHRRQTATAPANHISSLICVQPDSRRTWCHATRTWVPTRRHAQPLTQLRQPLVSRTWPSTTKKLAHRAHPGT